MPSQQAQSVQILIHPLLKGVMHPRPGSPITTLTPNPSRSILATHLQHLESPTMIPRHTQSKLVSLPVSNLDVNNRSISDDTSGGHNKRGAPGSSPGNNPANPPFIIGQTGARIFYDRFGFVRVLATTTLSYVVQSFFENVGNEVRNLGAAVAHAVDRGNTWNADYNQNFQAQTITLGLNFYAGDEARALDLANELHAYFSQNHDHPPGGISLLLGPRNTILDEGLDPNAQRVLPPPPEPTGAPGRRLMARQAGVTDFCTAPAANAYNLVVGTPDGAVTGGSANMISC